VVVIKYRHVIKRITIRHSYGVAKLLTGSRVSAGA